ncbi:MAG: toxin-antitoxin system YwqK family antitoxin, partial [Crocinitomicaceae bacterium]
LIASFAFAQKPLKDVYLKRTLKQDGLQYEFKVLDDDKHGVWFYDKEKFYFWYKAQGVKSTQGESSGTLLHGNFESFYENDQLHQKGIFKRGLKCGEWLHWREDGSLIYTAKWSKGELKAKKWYSESGKVYRSERAHGRNWKTDKADTVIVTHKLFKIERRAYRDSSGKLMKVENWKKGSLHGKSTFYKEGKLERTEKYKKGELVSSTDDVKEPKEEKPKREKKERKKKTKEEE